MGQQIEFRDKSHYIATTSGEIIVVPDFIDKVLSFVKANFELMIMRLVVHAASLPFVPIGLRKMGSISMLQTLPRKVRRM